MASISKITAVGEQTAENCETISQGAHICISVIGAKGDVKLRKQLKGRWHFILCKKDFVLYGFKW